MLLAFAYRSSCPIQINSRHQNQTATIKQDDRRGKYLPIVEKLENIDFQGISEEGKQRIRTNLQVLGEEIASDNPLQYFQQKKNFLLLEMLQKMYEDQDLSILEYMDWTSQFDSRKSASYDSLKKFYTGLVQNN